MYLIAVKPIYGTTGDKVSVVLADGTVINCVIADIKANENGITGAAIYGHNSGNRINIIEFEAVGGTNSVYIQKSKGYSLRPAVPCSKISEIVDVVKKLNKEIYIIVDNCYGEFTETTEPTAVGADLAVGSLIKNPGGGIARSGGYIVGKKKLVDMCAQRLTVPGFEKEIGASLNLNRELFLGFFNAPSVVEQALKTSVFASALFTLMGYDVFPKYDSYRADIVTAILLRNSDNLVKFCQTIQKWSPIDSFIHLEPWPLPGYSDKIIMASGSFTSGSSIELSADSPIREPYAVYLQGSLNHHLYLQPHHQIPHHQLQEHAIPD